MLWLHDERSGRAEPVRPARQGVLSIYAAPGGDRSADDLRDLLVADLIGRVAARHHLRVSAWHNVSASDGPGAPWADGPPDLDGQEFWAACGAMNIYPAQFSAGPPDPLDVGVGPAHGDPASAPGSHWVRVASTSVPGAGLVPGGGDPLALRFALLSGHYRAPLRLGPEDLRAAGARLRTWRGWVAQWATFASGPIPAGYLGEITGAFDDDLDFPCALRALGTLAADPQVPPGAKFETFAHIDQVLGLDLARDVGR